MTTFVAGQILTAADLNSIRTPGAWTSWNVTFTANLTKGNMSDASSYFQAGKLVVAKMHLTFGSTSSITAALPVFSLPVTATSNGYGGGLLTTYRDVSASADYDGFIRIAGNAAGYLEAKNVAGANDVRTGISSTAPFTWAAGDLITGYLIYEAA